MPINRKATCLQPTYNRTLRLPLQPFTDFSVSDPLPPQAPEKKRENKSIKREQSTTTATTTTASSDSQASSSIKIQTELDYASKRQEELKRLYHDLQSRPAFTHLEPSNLEIFVPYHHQPNRNLIDPNCIKFQKTLTPNYVVNWVTNNWEFISDWINFTRVCIIFILLLITIY